MDFKRKLPIPKEIKKDFPLSEKGAAVRDKTVSGIRGILSGKDHRLLLIIGPCSADREDSVCLYLEKLLRLQEKVKDKVCLVARLYTGKPRSKGNAYKGMLHNPDPKSGHEDILKGLLSIREIHLKALEQIGIGCADELLYPESYRFVSDLLCYATVGARSSENQQHRLTASGLDIPVGFKNPMNGDLSSLMQAIETARNEHLFIYRNWEVQSQGNAFAHGILRGYVDHLGINHPNYDLQSLRLASEMINGTSGSPNNALLIDCNHSNSGKNFLKQADIAKDVCSSRKTDPSVRDTVKGLMIESYLEDGAQNECGTTFGQSITDPCLGWDKSEKLVLELAELW